MLNNILSKKQEFELLTAIKGRGEIPMKFGYFGKGAYNWAAIAKERAKKGGINKIEGDLLKTRTEDFLRNYRKIKEVNIIDIGCGDAIPTYPLLDKIKDTGIRFNYIPVDISETMLNLACTNTKKKYNISCKPILLDLESGQFSDKIYKLRKNGTANLLLFLGSTIGNFSDTNRVLSNFLESMSSEDFLIIGVELTNLFKVEQLIPHYKNKLIYKFFYYLCEMIGFKKNDIEFIVLWNSNYNRVELKMRLKKDASIKIGNESFVLNKGEVFLLMRSNKYTEWSLTKLLSDSGFRTELLTTNENRGYVLSMIQPTRYTV